MFIGFSEIEHEDEPVICHCRDCTYYSLVFDLLQDSPPMSRHGFIAKCISSLDIPPDAVVKAVDALEDLGEITFDNFNLNINQ